MGEYIVCKNSDCPPLSDYYEGSKFQRFIVKFKKPFEEIPQVGIFIKEYKEG